MAQEYARLELLQDVTTESGGKAHELVIFRPSARDLFSAIDATTTTKRVEQFVQANVRALNGSGETPSQFKASELTAADVMEIVAVIGSLADEAKDVPIDDGDGITAPLVYTLQHPIHLTPGQEGGDVIHQIQFEARRLGDISEFLDVVGDTQEFKVFMRLFGTLLGTKLPMSDTVINAIDFVDYFVIRRKIMGKLVAPRERWKRTST